MLRRAFLCGLLVALYGTAQASNIVFSGAADLGNVSSGPSLSTTYTVGSGNNRVLVICFVGDIVAGSTVTYGGVTMTGPVAVDSNQTQELFYLLNPASGSNTFTLSYTSGSSYIQVIAADYSNVKQVGQPDGTGIADDTIAEDTFSGGYATTQ